MAKMCPRNGFWFSDDLQKLMRTYAKKSSKPRVLSQVLFKQLFYDLHLTMRVIVPEKSSTGILKKF